MGEPALKITESERLALSSLFDLLRITGGMLDLFERHTPGAADEAVQWAVRNRINVERQAFEKAEELGPRQVIRVHVSALTKIVVYL